MPKVASPDAPQTDSFAAEFASAAPPPARELAAEHARARIAAQMFGAAPRVTALGSYTVLRELGRGGAGVVHEGRGPGGLRVALKTLRHPDPEAIHRLKDEFRRAADLGHPNLAAVYELARDDAQGQWFLAMEYVPGDTWLAHLRPGGAPPSLPALRRALAQLAAGVHALHQAGLLHRDLKPSNVLVTGDGRVKIVDFGLARLAAVDDVLDLASPAGYLARLAAGDDEFGLAGTAGYLAPELLSGARPSPASDWFAVGVMLFEALTGRRPQLPLAAEPFAADIPADLDALCRELLAPAEARPPGLEILRRLGLDVRPAARPVFVGRARELAACTRALADPPALLLLLGPSGAGKSTLLARLAEKLRRERGALVLSGRCYAGESVPYKALDGVVDALTQHLRSGSFKHVFRDIPEETPDLLRVFPAFARVLALAPDDPGDVGSPRETRRRAVAALRRVLARLAGAPVVLAIDDLQWGDADSVRLLGELLAPPDPPPLLVVASVRDDVRPHSPFFAELSAAPLPCPVHELAVAPLDPADAETLAASLLRTDRAGDPARPALAAAIARESQGNPLFIEAMARRLTADPSPPRDLARTSLDSTLRAEIAELEPALRITLERLAVAGRPLRRDLALRATAPAVDHSAAATAPTAVHHPAAVTGTASESASAAVTGTAPGSASADPSASALDPAALAVLGARHLLRTAGDGDTVETYHDRVREVVLQQLAPGDRRAHHRALALALAAEPDPDADELVLHFHGAGDLPRAGVWALRAAERAADALAFTRAADLYARALAWSTLDARQVFRLTLARADALVHAGRCAEAAPVYLAAAAVAPDRVQELALRGRAVEQYLVSGRVEAGLATLRPLAHELGLPFPAGSARSLAGLLGELARLAIARRLPARPPAAAAAVDPEMLLRLDLCWSAGKGLGFIDPIRAAAISAHGLRLALACGEPHRLTRAAAYLTIVDANAPAPRRARAAARELAAARTRALALADPHLIGLTTVLSGVTALNNGQWDRAIAEVEAGADLLRARCVGVHWERAIAHAMAMHAHLMRGEFATLRLRAEAWQHEAEDTGDRFAVVVAALYTAHVALAAGDPPGARAAAGKALAMWRYDRFSFQHWLALRLEVACDLYEGRGQAAWDRVERAWPALVRSQLMHMQIPRIDAHSLRASAALAAARHAPPAAETRQRQDRSARVRTTGGQHDRRALVRTALAAAVALAGERIGLARAAEALIRGQLAVLDGAPADELLHTAADRFAAGAMPALAAAVRLGCARPPARARAAAALAGRGVREPERWAASIAPVLHDSSP